jgi:hypothetical protein
MPTEVQGNRAYNPEHKLSVQIPAGWKVRNVLGLADPDAIMNLAPIGATWPNIEITLIGKVRDASIETTRMFAHSFLRKRGWPIIGERMLEVAGIDAYEVSYEHQFPRWMFWLSRARNKKYSKVSLIKENTEYLIQLASEDWGTDKPLFDKFVQSLHFGP